MPGNRDILAEDSCGAIALDWTLTPAEAVRRWPAPLALVCLAVPGAGGSGAGSGAGWTVFTTPIGSRRGGLGLLDGIAGDGGEKSGPLPFVGGCVGVLDYEAGFEAEPTALTPRAPRPPRTGRRRGCESGDGLTLLECPAALIHDASTNQWWRVGAPGTLDGLPDLARLRAPSRDSLSWRCGGLVSVQGREAYVDAAARAVEYTRAGDVFQANIAHQLRADFEGSARGLFGRLLESARPRHGAFVELGGEGGAAVCSISPELFLEVDFTSGAVRTRPIKGTRPARLVGELRASEKDAAELVMIVDLMRNDLGRVCRYGSVRVDSARVIERHGPIVHGVATVSGRLGEGVGIGGLMRAAFPAGSVTGAPKVRAMQVIDELEGFRRGVYCGSIGFVSRCGRSVWNVAIRTATIGGGEIVYPVGAGIVEGSVPEMEWEETLHKAEAFTKVLREGVVRRAGVTA